MKNSANFGKQFICKICDYSCRWNSDFEKHLTTLKHKNRTKMNKTDYNIFEFKFTCKYCFKNYKARNSLWYHEKNCENKNNENQIKNNENQIKNNENQIKNNEFINNKDDFIMILIKQNAELLEVIKNGTHNNNSHNTNCYNKSFNLQFFLNETCKDAMNIMDFVDSIKLQLADLENVGKVGFVNGISKIIIKNLNALDETQRPVHCTDKKREVIYVKDENKWEKDENDYNKIRKAIKVIAKKNSKLLFEFKEKHPECIDGESKYSDKYNKLFIEAYGGSGNEDQDNENKIIKNISKEIIINKE
jgi:hypothetical protein